MPSIIHIRTAIPSDLEAIAAILNQAIEEQCTAYDSPVTAGQMRTWWEEHRTDALPVVVAERDGAVVAWASLSAYRRGRKTLNITAEISFYVDRSSRHLGIASRLIRHLEGLAGSLGIQNLFGIVLDDNRPSIKLMEKHGYQQWAHLPEVAAFDGQTKGHVYLGKRLNELA